MNLLSASETINTNNDIQTFNFNQDCSSLVVGTKTGYRLYAIDNSEILKETYSCNNDQDLKDVKVVERLFSNSLIAVVSMSNPRKLRVYNFKKGTEICNYTYPSPVLSVRLNRNRLVVCLEERIDIHNLSDMQVIHSIENIPSNPNGLCALSANCEKSYLAYPSNNQIGELKIFDTIYLNPITTILAHESPLAAIAIDLNDSKIATASDKGTVIKVFSLPQGEQLFEFRRGLRTATINSLSFSPNSDFLSTSSNLGTVHIFRLEGSLKKTQDDQTWTGYFSSVFQSAASYIYTQASEERAFATANVPQLSLKYRNSCALSYFENKLRLLLACADGNFYIFEVNTLEGGTCNLITQNRFCIDDGSCDFVIFITRYCVQRFQIKRLSLI